MNSLNSIPKIDFLSEKSILYNFYYLTYILFFLFEGTIYYEVFNNYIPFLPPSFVSLVLLLGNLFYGNFYLKIYNYKLKNPPKLYKYFGSLFSICLLVDALLCLYYPSLALPGLLITTKYILFAFSIYQSLFFYYEKQHPLEKAMLNILKIILIVSPFIILGYLIFQENLPMCPIDYLRKSNEGNIGFYRYPLCVALFVIDYKVSLNALIFPRYTAIFIEPSVAAVTLVPFYWLFKNNLRRIYHIFFYFTIFFVFSITGFITLFLLLNFKIIKAFINNLIYKNIPYISYRYLIISLFFLILFISLYQDLGDLIYELTRKFSSITFLKTKENSSNLLFNWRFLGRPMVDNIQSSTIFQEQYISIFSIIFWIGFYFSSLFYNAIIFFQENFDYFAALCALNFFVLKSPTSFLGEPIFFIVITLTIIILNKKIYKYD